MKAVKLTLALALLGASNLASADFWSTNEYGNVSSYSGTTMGNWQLSGGTWKDYVFKGETLECAKGSTSCTQTYTKAVNFNWTWGVGLSTDFTIIPDVWSLGVTAQYSENRGYTDTNTYSVTIKPGQRSQYRQYVPRRYGYANVWGVRTKTNQTRVICVAHFITCLTYATEVLYREEPSKKAAVIKGWKATADKPTHTFYVTNW